jgi:hypothetical protein
VPKNCAPLWPLGASEVRGDARIGEETSRSGGGEATGAGTEETPGGSEITGGVEAGAGANGVIVRCGDDGRIDGTTCSTSGMEPRPDDTGARVFSTSGMLPRPAGTATGMREDDGASSTPTGSAPGTPSSSCRKMTST